MDYRDSETNVFFNKLRSKEFSRLDRLGHVYLDYTGGNIYPECLINKHQEFLKHEVYGNPHSVNPSSLLSGKLISRTRERVLAFFNAWDYYCIFTQNASGALQIVGECYPFDKGSKLLLTADNHNSVNGIREYCHCRGGESIYSEMNAVGLSINENELNKNLQASASTVEKLFAFPAQSNVSGVRHSLHWVKKAHDLGWDVLLDAAAYVPTSRLDLSVHQPDFVSISFYKIFGYPTGIGCLLVKKSKLDKLKKPWFAGGTILLSAVKYPARFLKRDHERFENGTVNYLDIPAIGNGLDFIESIGIEHINNRIKALSGILLSGFASLSHDNGLPLIKLYGPKHSENRGGSFAFNFLDQNQICYPLNTIEELAGIHKISLRTGCFCNPGVDELNHGITREQLQEYFEGREQGDYDEFITFQGRPRGAVRLSVGLATTIADIEKFFLFARLLLNKTADKPIIHLRSQKTSNSAASLPTKVMATF